MHHVSLYLLLACLVLSSGCSSSKKKNQQVDSINQTEEDSAALVADSLSNEMDNLPVPGISPAPGSLRAEVEILGIEETDNGLHCLLKIVKINGYGSNTPPLAEGTELTANVSKETLLKASQDPASNDNISIEMVAEKLKSQATQNVTLKYQQVPNLPGVKPNPWRVLSIRP
ncbi:MAG: hypothetical protein AB8G77_28015 [Rhodothermales bacterium]